MSDTIRRIHDANDDELGARMVISDKLGPDEWFVVSPEIAAKFRGTVAARLYALADEVANMQEPKEHYRWRVEDTIRRAAFHADREGI